MTFTSFHEHSSPIFRKLNIIKLDDLISYHVAGFKYTFNNSLLPSAFDAFFSKVSKIPHYNTRSAAKQLYYLPRARTNHGKFNIRFQGCRHSTRSTNQQHNFLDHKEEGPLHPFFCAKNQCSSHNTKVSPL